MIGYPLDSHVEYDTDGTPIYDRAISSAPMRKLYKKLFSDGVLPNPSTNMQVSAGDGMNVIVYPGFAMCNGCMKLEEAQRTLAIQASSTAYDRIDTVVLRLNDNDSERICDFYILHGTPAVSPVRPELTRTESIWELGLADLFIAKNSTVISNQRITDTRYETARCGVMSSISEFDSDTIYQQVQADLAGFKAEEQADFIAWFDEIKGQLSEDAAGNLQVEIDDINSKIGSADISEIGDGTVTGAIASQNEALTQLNSSLGTVVTDYTSQIDEGTSIGTAAWKSMAYMKLPAGKWLIFAKANLKNSASACLMQRIIKTNTSNVLIADSVTSAQRYISSVAYVELTELTSIYLQAYSDIAGTTANAKDMFAVRVG